VAICCSEVSPGLRKPSAIATSRIMSNFPYLSRA
jgi:hypothetical protein